MKTTKKKMKTKCYSKTTIRVVTGVEEKSGNSTSSSDSNRRRSARKQILKKKNGDGRDKTRTMAFQASCCC